MYDDCALGFGEENLNRHHWYDNFPWAEVSCHSLPSPSLARLKEYADTTNPDPLQKYPSTTASITNALPPKADKPTNILNQDIKDYSKSATINNHDSNHKSHHSKPYNCIESYVRAREHNAFQRLV